MLNRTETRALSNEFSELMRAHSANSSLAGVELAYELSKPDSLFKRLVFAWLNQIQTTAVVLKDILDFTALLLQLQSKAKEDLAILGSDLDDDDLEIQFEEMRRYREFMDKLSLLRELKLAEYQKAQQQLSALVSRRNYLVELLQPAELQQRKDTAQLVEILEGTLAKAISAASIGNLSLDARSATVVVVTQYRDALNASPTTLEAVAMYQKSLSTVATKTPEAAHSLPMLNIRACALQSSVMKELSLLNILRSYARLQLSMNDQDALSFARAVTRQLFNPHNSGTNSLLAALSAQAVAWEALLEPAKLLKLTENADFGSCSVLTQDIHSLQDTVSRLKGELATVTKQSQSQLSELRTQLSTEAQAPSRQPPKFAM